MTLTHRDRQSSHQNNTYHAGRDGAVAMGDLVETILEPTTNLEDRNLLKLRNLDSSCQFFLSDNSIWGQ